MCTAVHASGTPCEGKKHEQPGRGMRDVSEGDPSAHFGTKDGNAVEWYHRRGPLWVKGTARQLAWMEAR